MRLFRFLRRKSDLTEEIESHLNMAIADRVARGQSPEEARKSAIHEFGNVPMVADATHDQWGWLRMELLIQDLRYALRQLRKEPGFTLTVVITLALGIGANTAIFTLVQGILLRSLPVNDPSRLYRIGDKNDCCYYNNYQNDNGDFDIFSYDLYLHLKQAAPEFEQLAVVEAGGNGFSVRQGAALARRMRSEYVSGNYFSTLGVGPYAGRLLNENDDTPGAPPTLVLSYKTRQSDFAAVHAIVGSTVYVEMHPFVVAGIAPPGFFGDRIITNPPDFWMPLASDPVLEGANSALKTVDELWLYPIGRVRPGVNIAALQTKLSVILQQWLATRPTYSDHGGAALIPRQHVILAPAGGGIQRLQHIPLGGNMWGSCVIPQGHPAPGPKDPCFAAWDRASSHFLDSIGVPIVRGRNFSTQDTATSQQVALVNQAFAKHFFPNQDAVGKHFGVNSIQDSGAFEIAGVFADFKMTDPRQEPRPLFFRPMSQQFHGYKEPDSDAAEKSSMFLNFIILDFTQAPPDAEALTRKTLAAIDPNLSVTHFSPYDAEVAGNFNQDRLLVRLTSSFGALALILASVGLYGVMSYLVVRRTSEIGIRMALGAARSGVIAMMLRGALWQLLIGLVIGIPAALVAGHFMASLLYEVKPYDPLAFLGAILLLTICATVAAFIPARRAASIDPIQALRTD